MMLLGKFAGEAFAINLYKPIAKMQCGKCFSQQIRNKVFLQKKSLKIFHTKI